MKFLFLVTEDNVTTLLRGVDFVHNSQIIFLLEEKKDVLMCDLNEVLFNAKKGFVVFTDDLRRCSELQNKIKNFKTKGG